MNLKIISAGAGSGKTYTLTGEMAKLLMPGSDGSPAQVRASGIIATTFTNKAAAELKERVRVKLLQEGLSEEADELGRAMIGTVHSVGVQLLKRFAFEAGISPSVDIIAEEDQKLIFNQSISTILSIEKTAEMERLSELLGFNKSVYSSKDWRSEMKNITEIARANNLNKQMLQKSRDVSISSYMDLFPPTSENSTEYYNSRLEYLIDRTIKDLKEHPDATKKKESLISTLFGIKKNLELRGYLLWYEWVQIASKCAEAPAKCKETVSDLKEFSLTHDSHPDFHSDLKTYIFNIFNLSIEALEEYELYKKSRGLIDYTDMEVMILKLLENQTVKDVLKDELDLLLVDEFQDTNPIQLKIFLQLTQIAKMSIWVGDPKQSIYGFRGAAPELMEAVIDNAGKDNLMILDHSWRSRQDLVYCVNGLFTEAFYKMSPERIALKVPEHLQKGNENPKLEPALNHWVFNCIDEKPDNNWISKAIAKAVSETLDKNIFIKDRKSGDLRQLLPGDIAILCRSNSSCVTIAKELNSQGINASIAQHGLLNTPEAALIIACLKFILNEQDTLAIAEILLLMGNLTLEEIIEKRFEFLNSNEFNNSNTPWLIDNELFLELNKLRKQSQEMSASEITNLLIEKFNVRQFVASWGQAGQRFSNIDSLKSYAIQYEDNCKRLNSAATLGGFLLWMEDLAKEKKDNQGNNTDMFSVNVLTYHKSKGLEWPFVVCSDLSNNLKERIFDVRIISESNQIDFKDPLAGRLISYWINPYGDLSKHTLATTIENHPQREIIRNEALEEETRLLYVGLTRARDYIVIPVIPQHRGKNLGIDWLNRVFHKGQSDLPSVDIMSDVCLWTWEGKEIPLKICHFNFEKNIETKEIEDESIEYFSNYSGEKYYPALIPDNLEELFNDSLVLELSDIEHYRNPLILTENDEDKLESLYEILHLFLRSDRIDYNIDLRLKAADHAIKQFSISQIINKNLLLKFSEAFKKQLSDKFFIQKMTTALNFKYKLNEQYFKGSLDYFIIIDNNSFVLIKDQSYSITEFKKKQKKKVKEISAFFSYAKCYLENKGLIGEYKFILHFPLEGALISLL